MTLTMWTMMTILTKDTAAIEHTAKIHSLKGVVPCGC
jgi:hypothetical protein